MSKIGPNNPNIPRRVAPPTNNVVNQQRTVDADVSKASLANASTLGRQVNRTGDEKKLETPKEKVTLTAQPRDADSNPVNQEKSAVVETPAEPEVQAPKQKTSDDLKMEFLNSFADNLSQADAKTIAEKASGSLVELASKGAGDVQHEKVIAAHTYNHAKKVISEKMPNASLAEIREAAKSDPELAKAVQLLDASSAYVKAAVNEGASAENGGAPKVEGQGQETPVTATNGPAAKSTTTPPTGTLNVDPFEASRQQGLSGGASGDGLASGDVPPDSGQPKSPYHVSPEKQAQIMAENHQSMLAISKIYTQMFAEMQKAAAERHQIMQETATSISDIYRQIHIRRAQSHAKHAAAYLSLIAELPAGR